MQGSRLPRGVILEGSVRGQGDLWIAGEILGPVEVDGQIVIEPTGVVRGEVRARAISIAGVLEGNATAIELVRLEPGARMVGDARAERVSAAAGALLRGRIRTGQDRAQQERMRRTTGGTLLAPFSSSGSVRAPSFTLEDEPVSAPVVSAPVVSAPVVSAAPISPRLEPTPEPAVRAAVEPRAGDDREPLRQLAARPHRDTIAAPPTGWEREDEPGPDRPPPPMIPAIGRRRAQRRGTEGTP